MIYSYLHYILDTQLRIVVKPWSPGTKVLCMTHPTFYAFYNDNSTASEGCIKKRCKKERNDAGGVTGVKLYHPILRCDAIRYDARLCDTI